MSKLKKITFKRRLVVIGCKKDFGLGEGVIAEDEATYSDLNNRGFDSLLFAASLIRDEEDFILRHVKVVLEEVKPKARGKKG